MDTQRIAYVIDKFREEHPDVEADVLLEFAGHVQRVLMASLREEAKADDAPVSISMQVYGQAFSAKGPRSYVESLLARWQESLAAFPHKNITPGFNRLKLMSGPTR